MTHIATPVATTYSGSQVTSWNVAVGTTVIVGHTLVLAVAGTNTTGQDGSFTATDAAGNTWAEAIHCPRTGTAQESILWTKLTSQLTSGQNITITHSAAGLARVAFIADEYDDITGFDVAASNTTGSGVNYTSGTTAAAAQNNQLLYSAVCWTGAVLDWTAGTGFSSPGAQSANNGASYQNLQTEYKYVNASGTRSADGTFGASKSWGGAIAAFNTTTPAQVAYPGSDITTTGWTKVGGTGTFASTLDETSPDDTDYVQSPNNPSASVFEVKWQPLSTPTDPTGDTIQLRLWYLTGSSGSAGVKLYEGATLRKDFGTTTLSTTPTTYSYGPLSTGENNSISDWTNLSIRITVTAA